MVHQVLVLRQEVGRIGGVVVGPNKSVEHGTLGEVCGHALERVGGDAHVGIDEEEDVALSFPDAAVACRSRTQTRLAADDATSEALGDLGGGVGRAVIDDDTFVVGGTGAAQRL